MRSVWLEKHYISPSTLKFALLYQWWRIQPDVSKDLVWQGSSLWPPPKKLKICSKRNCSQSFLVFLLLLCIYCISKLLVLIWQETNSFIVAPDKNRKEMLSLVLHFGNSRHCAPADHLIALANAEFGNPSVLWAGQRWVIFWVPMYLVGEEAVRRTMKIL